MLGIFRKSLVIRSFCTQPASKLIDSLVSSLDAAVDRESLDKLLTSVPQLTRYGPDQWHRTHQLMAAEGIEPAKFLSIVSTYPEILGRDPDRLAGSLHCWRSCQFGDRQMQALLAAHPQLLDLTDQGKLAARVAFLHSYFETRKNVWRLFLNCPNLVAEGQGSIQPKVEYILQRMRIEVPEVVKSCALAAEMELIRCRHVFLERLGLFKPRSLKADPGDPNDNPKLHQITDTSDKRFAVKVAYVTLEEYEAFQELFAREGNRRNRDEVEGGEDEYEYDGGKFGVERDDDSVSRKKSYRKKSKRKHS